MCNNNLLMFKAWEKRGFQVLENYEAAIILNQRDSFEVAFSLNSSD